MERETKSFQPTLSDETVETLKRRLMNMVEPLSDHQLLDLADGIHEMLRQRRAVRQHHAERINDPVQHGVNLLV
jgi:predicted exporter